MQYTLLILQIPRNFWNVCVCGVLSGLDHNTQGRSDLTPGPVEFRLSVCARNGLLLTRALHYAYKRPTNACS